MSNLIKKTIVYRAGGITQVNASEDGQIDKVEIIFEDQSANQTIESIIDPTPEPDPIPTIDGFGQFEFNKDTYIKGQDGNIRFTIGKDFPSNATIQFYVWSVISNKMEGEQQDNNTPFIYAKENLNKATDGGGWITAKIKDVNGNELKKIALRVTFKEESQTSPVPIPDPIIPIEPTPIPVQGWTPIKVSSDTKKIYVSNSSGNDNNDGSESKPIKTLKKSQELARNGFPDHIYLKVTDDWNEQFGTWSKSGRSKTEPMVITTYGTGRDRAKILSRNTGIQFLNGTSNINIIGLYFYHKVRDPKHTEFDKTISSKYGLRVYGTTKNILVENCKFQYYFQNIAFMGPNNATLDKFAKGFILRRSIILDAYEYDNMGHGIGLYSASADDILIEDSIFDHNGWNEDAGSGAGADIFSHNIYLQYSNGHNIIVRNNVIGRGASHGIQMRSGGLCENNFIFDNGLHGFGDHFKDCVFLGGRDINSSTIRGWGIELSYDTGILENCIFANKFGVGRGMAVNCERKDKDNKVISQDKIVIKGNKFYKWEGHIFEIKSNCPDFSFEENEYQECFDDQPIIRLVRTPTLKGRNNTYNSNENDTNRWFRQGNNYFGFDQYITISNEINSKVQKLNYKDPNRNLDTYAKSISLDNKLDIIGKIRNLSKDNWDNKYIANTINNYIRDGFNKI